jgi:hypothetical protein
MGFALEFDDDESVDIYAHFGTALNLDPRECDKAVPGLGAKFNAARADALHVIRLMRAHPRLANMPLDQRGAGWPKWLVVQVERLRAFKREFEKISAELTAADAEETPAWFVGFRLSDAARAIGNFLNKLDHRGDPDAWAAWGDTLAAWGADPISGTAAKSPGAGPPAPATATAKPNEETPPEPPAGAPREILEPTAAGPSKTAAVTPAAAPASGVETVPEGAELVSAPQLARLLQKSQPTITEDAVRAKLRRHAEQFPDCCIPNEHPKRGDAKYFYRFRDVIDLFQVTDERDG